MQLMPSASQPARYTTHVVATAIDFLVLYSRTPDEEEKEQRSILATIKRDSS